MPLLVAPRSSHGVALVDHQHHHHHQRHVGHPGVFDLQQPQYQPPNHPKQCSTAVTHEAASHHQLVSSRSADLAVDFSMSKFKASSRHSLYRQFYGGDESPPYEKPEESEPAEPEGREKSFGKVWLSNEAQWHHPIAMSPGQPPAVPTVAGSPMPTAAPPPLNMSLPPASAMGLHASPHQQPLYLNPTSLMSLREMMMQSPAGLSLLNADNSGPLGLLKRSMLESIPSGSSPAPFSLGLNPLVGLTSSGPSVAAATATYSLPSMIPTTVGSLSQHEPQQLIKKERDESDIEMDDRDEDEDGKPSKHRRTQSPSLHRPQLSPPFRASPPSTYYRPSTLPSPAIDQVLPHRSSATVSHQPHLYHTGGSSATSSTVAALPSHQRQHQRDSAEREQHLNARAKNDRDGRDHSKAQGSPSQHHLHQLPFVAGRAELELFRDQPHDGSALRPFRVALSDSEPDVELDEGRRKETRPAHREQDVTEGSIGPDGTLHERDLRFGAMAANEMHLRRHPQQTTRSKSSSPGE
ncbi:mastermind-like domain-containing protein 1 [Anopheles nili]|uniref:mastermind-like domain-containing protein 1 n=1 Tax=Anopheles nili TaxID=185578 RepID=UPI00237B8265|nr:mastermind-like domain-containing protein 1 [Anopheles nili]